MKNERGLGNSLNLLDASELVSLADGGRSEALSELYERYSGMLLGMAVGILRNRQDAEEVLQEAFLYAWKNADTYDPSRSSVSTWLILITRSRSIDRLRSRRRIGETHSHFQRQEQRAKPFSEGFSHVLRREQADRLRAAMSRLPATQRQVLELCFYHDLTQTEAAEQSEIPLGTIKTRSHLAIQKLRQELAGEIRQLM